MKEKKLEISNNLQDLDATRLLVKTTAGNLLFHNKTDKYPQRFKSWAKNTNGEHLENLVDALLSAVAYAIATGKVTTTIRTESLDRVQGIADGILLVQEWIRVYASETRIITEDEE